MWLIEKLTPDHKTIANFRKDNAHALKQVCREFTLLCRRLDLFGGELVAVDGSKFRADNSRKRNYNEKRLEKLIKAVDERVASYLTELDEADQAEPEVVKLSATELQEKISKLKERKAHYEGLAAKLKESSEQQISTTDPDSRLMKCGPATEVCYNVQAAVDAKHKLIVEHEVTQDVTDKNQLSAMAVRAKEALGVEHLEVVAERGLLRWCRGQEVSAGQHHTLCGEALHISQSEAWTLHKRRVQIRSGEGLLDLSTGSRVTLSL